MHVMAARRHEPEPKRNDGPAPSLRHNPFAALRKEGATPSSSLENARELPVADAAPRGGRDHGSRSSGAKQSKPVVHAGIVVRREKKGRGGKAVTIVEGAGLAGSDLDELARELAKSLGAGARVEEGTIVVQGEQSERVVAALQKRGFGGIVRGN